MVIYLSIPVSFSLLVQLTFPHPNTKSSRWAIVDAPPCPLAMRVENITSVQSMAEHFQLGLQIFLRLSPLSISKLYLESVSLSLSHVYMIYYISSPPSIIYICPYLPIHSIFIYITSLIVLGGNTDFSKVVLFTYLWLRSLMFPLAHLLNVERYWETQVQIK